MSIKRYIADLHFGHKNLATHRGFQDESYQDEHIIKEWNKVVTGKKDITFILGDVTMEKRTNYHLLDRLNGRKVVVLGNHDAKNHVPTLLEYVDSVCASLKVRHEGVNIMLTHIPVHPMEFDYRLAYNIHGHIHDLEVLLPNGEPDSRYIKVCAESVDYKPKTLEQLLKNKKLCFQEHM